MGGFDLEGNQCGIFASTDGDDDELMALVIAADHALQHLCNDLSIRTLEGPTAPVAEPKSLGISKRALEVRDRQQVIR